MSGVQDDKAPGGGGPGNGEGEGEAPDLKEILAQLKESREYAAKLGERLTAVADEHASWVEIAAETAAATEAREAIDEKVKTVKDGFDALSVAVMRNEGARAAVERIKPSFLAVAGLHATVSTLCPEGDITISGRAAEQFRQNLALAVRTSGALVATAERAASHSWPAANAFGDALVAMAAIGKGDAAIADPAGWLCLPKALIDECTKKQPTAAAPRGKLDGDVYNPKRAGEERSGDRPFKRQQPRGGDRGDRGERGERKYDNYRR
ncbi:hypothetical protein MNEG_12349 [Monoraphidium neglectum]|jgi:hypothetical protein|uniref:Uncharacterized protein n=1 Tax=Monoraphidium neglectum TaxID=145388 RepID=A0A0D2LVT3_9CHLO|nr:hypothetical protein MNEG_12349 [Monoraphidium neglectum]KIY95614.1 hypothetical protein MNEG_12349 [Monoraphidium neglectum]|eukprot:XP_013894634.1 hypothetical protein MNEG_12349 [Monoraphidium neglectum]